MNARCYGPGRLEKGPNYAGTKVVWYGVWTDARGRRCKRILSTDKRVAERAIVRIVRDRDLEVLGLKEEDGQDRRLREISDLYLADMATWASRSHYRRVRGILKRLIEDVGDVRVRDLKKERILLHRQKRLRQGKANRTCNQECGALNAMLNWSVQSGFIGRNPIAGLKPLPSGKAHEKNPRRALWPKEIDVLLTAADRVDTRVRAYHAAERSIADGSRGAPYKERPRRPYVPQSPLWRAFLCTGARWNELTSTVWQDYDAETRTLRLRVTTTKSKRQRVIPLIEDIVEDLSILRAVHRHLLGREPTPAEHIFLGPRGKPVGQSYRRALYRFRQLCEEAGIAAVDELGQHIDIHSLRHTFCTELGRAGVGLTQAQALMGHSDPKLTAALYTHLGVEDLREAVERLPLRGQPASVSARARRPTGSG